MGTQQIPLTVVVRIQDISGGSRGTSIYFVRASGDNDKIYRIASLANQFVLIVSQSASRIISAVPFSKSTEIIPIRRRSLLDIRRLRRRFSFCAWFWFSVSAGQHGAHLRQPAVLSVCPPLSGRLALHRWLCCPQT